MALAALSPWPATTATVARAAAVECLKAGIAADDLTDDRINAMGETVSALVERYAPDAPQAVKNEATIRAAGWLLESPSSGIRDERGGELSAGYSPSMTGCLRHSGAMGLLSPWKSRRGGSIG